jgi:hypothetical protein
MTRSVGGVPTDSRARRRASLAAVNLGFLRLVAMRSHDVTLRLKPTLFQIVARFD